MRVNSRNIGKRKNVKIFLLRFSTLGLCSDFGIYIGYNNKWNETSKVLRKYMKWENNFIKLEESQIGR